MANPNLQLTLDDAVGDVLGLLTGLNLTYQPELDRYRAVTRALNRALRRNALEHEWSWYHSTAVAGNALEGVSEVWLDEELRPRIINDDAVRLRDENGNIVRWAYFLPRDALHKYRHRGGLWVSSIRNVLAFSRPFNSAEDGLDILVPVMREPEMFKLPAQPEDPDDGLVEVPDSVRQQLVDFAYPEVIVARAAFHYAQTDPVMQPRVQMLEAEYKDLMYQAIERDDRNTDTPYLNEFILPVQSGLYADNGAGHHHPHSDWRY